MLQAHERSEEFRTVKLFADQIGNSLGSIVPCFSASKILWLTTIAVVFVLETVQCILTALIELNIAGCKDMVF